LLHNEIILRDAVRQRHAWTAERIVKNDGVPVQYCEDIRPKSKDRSFERILMEVTLDRIFGNKKKRTAVRKFAVVGASLGLALSAMTASAQTAVTPNVQVYGLIGVYLDRLQRSDMSSSVVQLGHGGLTTSYWGVRGSEDLGGGLRAFFALESFFQPDTGGMGRNASDGLFSRNAYVGLASGAGNVSFGRHTNPTYGAMRFLSPFGSSVVFSPLVVQTFVAPYGGAIIGDTVWNNAIQYVTPNLSGFTGTLIHGLGEVPGRTGVNNTGLHVTYEGGPLTGVVSAQRNRTAAVAPSTGQDPLTGVVSAQRNRTAAVAPSTGQDAYLVGAAYDLKVAKVFASTVRTSADVTNVDTRTYDLGVAVPVSAAGQIWLEWANTKRTAPGSADTKRDTASLAYDHRLSKRTDLYAVYSRDKLTNNPAGNTYGVGIRHTF
jgi:predicted porin